MSSRDVVKLQNGANTPKKKDPSSSFTLTSFTAKPNIGIVNRRKNIGYKRRDATITKDLRQYLATKFTKNSVNSELQHQIRENLHMRVVPCTTRSRQGNEQQGVGPQPTQATCPGTLAAPAEVLPSVPSYRSGPASQAQPPIPRNLGPLPPNWEIAYTENNEKYFIEQVGLGTRDMGGGFTAQAPHHSRLMKHTLLDCEENELPYGWEKPHQSRNPVRESSHGCQETLRWGTAPAASRRHPWCHAPSPSPALHAIGGGPGEAEGGGGSSPVAGGGAGLGLPGLPRQSGWLPGRHDDGGRGAGPVGRFQGEVVKTTLLKTATHFGFTIIGGDRPGELLQIKTIQKGSAADKDGRLQVGDVIVYINGILVLTYNHHKVVDLFKSIPMGSTVTLEVRRGYPLPDYQDDKLPPYTASSNQNFPRQSPVPPVGVLDAAHQDVINYMGEAAAQGEVTLKIRRKVPPLELNPHTSYMPAEDNEPLIPQGIRRVLITRPNTQTSFGFVLQSNTLRAGCIVCRLVQGSPADQSGQLYQFDELISVNGQDVSHMDHSDEVTLIKASGTTTVI
eukprot:Em0001g3212a